MNATQSNSATSTNPTKNALNEELEVDYQSMLTSRGAVVIPTPLSTDVKMRANVRRAFDASLIQSPEFLNPNPADQDWIPVLGGFSALGNASSFHSKFARMMREMTFACLLDLDVLPCNGRRVEVAYDRLLLRREGLQISIDGDMHRDECPYAKKGDDVMGGWINLDDTPQTFRCVFGSHLDVGNQNTGFAKLGPEEVSKYSPRLVDVEIPAGSIIVFYERIVHLVLPSKAPRTMYRMFLGFRLTDDDQHLLGAAELNRVIENQAVPRLKSGQIPRLWPKSYQNFSRNFQLLTDWSTRTFQPQLVKQVTVKSSNASAWYNGVSFLRVEPEMRSLKDLGLPLHPTYDSEEVLILTPQQMWHLRTFESPQQRVRCVVPSKLEWNAYMDVLRQGFNARRPRAKVFDME